MKIGTCSSRCKKPRNNDVVRENFPTFLSSGCAGAILDLVRMVLFCGRCC